MSDDVASANVAASAAEPARSEQTPKGAKEAASGQANEQDSPAVTAVSWSGAFKDWCRVFLIGLKTIVKPASGDVVVPVLHRRWLVTDGVVHHELQQFATWRLGALSVSFVFYCVFAGLQGRAMRNSVDKKAEILSAFPPDIKLFAASLPKAMAIQEIIYFASLLLAVVCVLSATCCWRHYKRSRLLVWIAWSLGLIVPFGITLVWPYRLSVDWDGALINVCQKTIITSLNGDTTMKLVFEKYATVTPSLVDFRTGVNTDTAKDFCKQHKFDWQAQWFGSPTTDGLFLSFMQTAVSNCFSKGLQLFSDSCTVQNCTLHPCLLGQNVTAAPTRKNTARRRRLSDAAVGSGTTPAPGDAGADNASSDEFDFPVGNWSYFPGQECDGSNDTASCAKLPNCMWIPDYNGLCLQNETMSNEQLVECANFTDPTECVADTNCRFNVKEWSCFSPLGLGFYARLDFVYSQSQPQDEWAQFGIQNYQQGLQCFRNSYGFCDVFTMVGDGECQLECAAPECAFDALDCCAYLGVDCGPNVTTRNQIMGEIYAKGMAYLEAGGSMDSWLSMFPNVDNPDYQDQLADTYGLSKEDMAGTSWDDMAASAAETYGSDGEAVDSALTGMAAKLAANLSKGLTLKSVGDIAEAVGTKVGRLQVSMSSKVVKSIKDAFKTIDQQGGNRRLADESIPDMTRRLQQSAEAILKANIQEAVSAETGKFVTKTVPQLKASASAVVMLQGVSSMAQVSQVATNMFKSAQYLLGILMGLNALKSLFPLAIGVVGGLTKGIINIHNLLPATVMGGYIETVVVFANLPLIAAFLATLYQVVGVIQILPGLILLICYLSMPGFRLFFYSFITDYMDRKQVKKADSRLSIVANIFLLGALAIFVWYLTGLRGIKSLAQEFIKRIRIKQLFAPEVIICKVAQIFATGLMTAVASADLIMSLEGLASAHFRRMEAKCKAVFRSVLANCSATVLHVKDVSPELLAVAVQATKDAEASDGGKEVKVVVVSEPAKELTCCDCVKDCCRVVCIGLVAIVKATSGSVTVPRYHKEILEKDGVNCKELQQYSVFRLGSLVVSTAFWCALVIVQAIAMNETVRKKAELLSSFPPDIKPFAASWPKHLMWMELVIFLSLVISGFLVFLATILWRRFKYSRYLVWVAWFIKVIVPFVVLMVWPYRDSVDWAGGVQFLCQKTVTGSVNSNPGMQYVFQAYSNYNPALKEWQQGVTNDAAKQFCSRNGFEWQANWFGSPGMDGQLFVFLKTAVGQCLQYGFDMANGTCTAANCSLNQCFFGNVSDLVAKLGYRRRLQGAGNETDGGSNATDMGDNFSLGDWTYLPGQDCATYNKEKPCNDDKWCEWDTDYNGYCIQNYTLATVQLYECLFLSGDPRICVANTNCRWNYANKYCEAPLMTGLYARGEWEQFKAETASSTEPLLQFWFQNFSQVIACYKESEGACDPFSNVGDGSCQLECASPACVFDALDCCFYLGVECGENATSRDQVMGPLYAKGAAFLEAGGSLDDLLASFPNLDDPDFQAALANEYGLNADDVKGTQWDDMDPGAAEDFANDPEGVDQSLTSMGASMAKSIQKSLKVKSPNDLVDSVSKKMDKLSTKIASKVLRTVKEKLGASRRLKEEALTAALSDEEAGGEGLDRRLQELDQQTQADLKAAVEATIATEMQTFQDKTLPPLQASATGMMLMNVMSTMTQSSTLATNLYKKSEYLLGAYMGLYALKSLLPMCIGVVGGLTKGIVNIHNLLPQTVIGGYIEIAVVAASVPQLAAFLATIYQIVGVLQIIPAFICLILFLAMPGWRMFFYSRIKDFMDRKQVQKADSRLSLVGNICLAVAIGIFIWYITGMDGIDEMAKDFLKGIRIRELFTGRVIYTKVITTISVSLMTAVAASDCVLSIEVWAGAHFRRLTKPDTEHLKGTFKAWSATMLKVRKVETDPGAKDDGKEAAQEISC